jgi:DNA repair exonuclease SbcCD ATPase subunit
MKITRIYGRDIFGYQSLDIPIKGDSILIYGQNGAGKSFLFDTVTWVLFGQFPRRISVNEVIRRGAKDCYAGIETDTGYCIKRERNSSGETEVSFKNAKDDIFQSYKPTKIQEEIDKLFLPYNIFSRTNYLVPGFMSFADASMTPENRMIILRRLVNLGIFKEAQKMCSARWSKAVSEKEDLNYRLNIHKETIEKAKEQLLSKDEYNRISEEIKTAEEKSKEWIKIDELVRELNDKEGNKIGLEKKFNSAEYSIQLLKDRIVTQKNKIKKAKDEYNFYIENLPKKKKMLIDEFNKKYSHLSDDTEKKEQKARLEQRLIAIKTFEDKVNSLKKEKMKLQSQLNNIPEGVECPVCNSELLIEEKEGKTVLSGFSKEKSIKIISDKIQEIEKEINSFVDKCKTKNGLIAEINRLNDLLELFTQKRIAENELKNEIRYLDEKANELNAAIKLAKENIDDISKTNNELEEIEKNRVQLKEKIDKLSEEINSISIVVRQKKDNFGNISPAKLQDMITNGKLRLGKFKDAQEAIFKQKDKVKEIEEKVARINLSIKKDEFWAKEGFKQAETVLMSKAIRQLEQGTNARLKQLGDVSVKFDNNKGLNISVVSGGEEWAFEQNGRGVRARIAISAAFSSRDISFGGGLESLLIDEAFDHIDVEGINAFMELLPTIGGQKFIISHDENLRGYNFNQTLFVEKKGDVSTVIDQS